MNRLAQKNFFDKDDYESLLICESCLLRRMTKLSFTGKDEQTSDMLGLIHTEVCGPMSTYTRGGYRYFIMFIDDLSRYGYVYLIEHKSESFEMFKRFCNEVEKQTGKNIKTLRFDRRGEYLFDKFLTYPLENGILS